MAYNEELAARVQEILEERVDPDERKMFGGIAFMVDGHMCCGVIKDDLMVRVGSEAAEKILRERDVRPMDFTGRPLKGFVYISPEGTRTEAKLRKRVDSALAFVAGLPPK